jgi:hypothetical protein
MSKAATINEQVKVIANFEDQEDGGFVCQPIKMEFQGSEITFSKFKINYADLSQSADEKVFDLFDQEKRYRLIFNMENLSWLLASIGVRYNS